MKIEDLLMPRWQLIATYPGCELAVGEIIIRFRNMDFTYYREKPAYNREYFFFGLKFPHVLYPHLFRPLQWWELREKSDLPKYVKYNDNSLFYPKKRVSLTSDNPFAGNGYTASDFMPATEQEFNDYVNSRKTTSP